jgi:uncharacterized membrane protein YfcA
MFQDIVGHLDVLHVMAGLLVGILVGLTGVGGGSLMTPLLVLLFGINAKTAVGTDLLFAAVTKSVGSAIHGWRNTVDWTIFRHLATGSMPAAMITVFMVQQVGEFGARTEQIIIMFLGAMLILTAISTLFRKQLILFTQRMYKGRDQRSQNVKLPTIMVGACIGFAVSISSVGAGAIGVTALLMLYPKLPVSRIVGTDIAHAVPLALIAGSGHWLYGDVDLLLLLSLLMGSIPGVIVGSLFSSRAPEHILRPALAAVLLFSGLKLLTG